MSGVLGSLAALGPLARAIEIVANLFRSRQEAAAAEAEARQGAAAAETETLRDTAEIADAQAALNSNSSDARDIARELRASADRDAAAARGGAGQRAGTGRPPG